MLTTKLLRARVRLAAIAALLLGLVLLLVPSEEQAQAGATSPANDQWRQAQEIRNLPGPGINRWARVTDNTMKATTEAGEPSRCRKSGIFKSVWYKVTPRKDGWLYLTTEGSSFDTVLGVYRGSSISTLSQVDCSNENFGANSTDKMSAPVRANKTYYVQLSGTGGARSGAYTLRARLHFGPGAWPDANWQPFSSTSPFNTSLSAYPNLKPLGTSPEIRNRIFSLQSAGGLAVDAHPNHIVTNPSGTGGEPTYYSKPRDPDFTLHCEGDPFGAPDGTCPLEGKVIDIPARAQAEGGREAQLNPNADRHLTVIDQATGLEYDLWQVKEVKPMGSSTRQRADELPAVGGDLYFSYGNSESIYGDGLTSGRAATAAYFASTAGRVRAEELAARHIDHALFIVVECVNGKVWPATGNGQQCSKRSPARGGPLPDDNAPPLGTRLYLNMTEAQINDLNIDPWKKTVLHALREYGAFIGDTGSKGYFAIEAEAGVQYKVAGNEDKWYSFGKNNWELYTGDGVEEYVAKLYKDSNDPPDPSRPDVNWDQQVWRNIVVLDECVTARTTPC